MLKICNTGSSIYKWTLINWVPCMPLFQNYFRRRRIQGYQSKSVHFYWGPCMPPLPKSILERGHFLYYYFNVIIIIIVTYHSFFLENTHTHTQRIWVLVHVRLLWSRNKAADAVEKRRLDTANVIRTSFSL